MTLIMFTWKTFRAYHASTKTLQVCQNVLIFFLPSLRTFTHAHIRTHTHTHARTHKHTRTHTHARTHTRTQYLLPSLHLLTIEVLGSPCLYAGKLAGTVGRSFLTRPPTRRRSTVLAVSMRCTRGVKPPVRSCTL